MIIERNLIPRSTTKGVHRNQSQLITQAPFFLIGRDQSRLHIFDSFFQGFYQIDGDTKFLSICCIQYSVYLYYIYILLYIYIIFIFIWYIQVALEYSRIWPNLGTKTRTQEQTWLTRFKVGRDIMYNVPGLFF